MKVLRVGSWKTGEPGAVLSEQDKPIDELLVIYNGEVAVVKDDAEVVSLRDGTWIGEMSYLQGGNASATVRVTRTTRYLAWPKGALTQLLKRNPTMDVAMQSVLSSDLIQKLSGNSNSLQKETEETPAPSIRRDATINSRTDGPAHGGADFYFRLHG